MAQRSISGTRLRRELSVWEAIGLSLALMAPSMPLIIRSAASFQPRWRSIISPERITEPGFTLSRFAYLGAVPCVASKMP